MTKTRRRINGLTKMVELDDQQLARVELNRHDAAATEMNNDLLFQMIHVCICAFEWDSDAVHQAAHEHLNNLRDAYNHVMGNAKAAAHDASGQVN